MIIIQNAKCRSMNSVRKGKRKGGRSKKRKGKSYSTLILSSICTHFYFLTRAGTMNISQHTKHKLAALTDWCTYRYSHIKNMRSHLAPVVHSVHPGSHNFDVNNVLIQSDSGMWSMDMCIKFPGKLAKLADSQTPRPHPWFQILRGWSLEICKSSSFP